MNKFFAGAAVLAAFGSVATSSFGAAVLYEPFDYEVGTQLKGQTNAGTGKVWIDPTLPGQPTDAADTQRMVAGNTPYPGLAAPVGNSLNLPNLPNGNISRLELAETYFYDAGTQVGNAPAGVFMSMTVKFAPTNNFTTANYFAGFHSGVGATGMSTSNGYAGMVWLRKDPLDSTKFQFGVLKNNAVTTPPFEIAYDTSHSFAVGDTAFLVFRYLFNTTNTTNDDTASIWVNPTPGDPVSSPSATATVGSDVFATSGSPPVTSSTIKSVYLRSNGSPATPSNLIVDELRVGLSYADVTPVPEPTGLAALAVGGAVALRRRRRQG